VNNSLQIYLLSRDRPFYLREALVSCLKQQCHDVEIVVSDNSEGSAVAEMIAKDFPLVKYVRRYPAIGAREHFRTVLEEVTADLFVMFHDDDLMLNDYVEVMRNAMSQDMELAAACPNALIMRGSRGTSELAIPESVGNTRIEKPEDMLRYYFSFSLMGVAPFPGYMYRRNKTQGLFLESKKGGKYADVSFLLEVVRRGPVLWMTAPLMYYRIHASNDSVTESVGERLRLLRYVYTTTSITPKSVLVAGYRYGYLMNWYFSSKPSNEQTDGWRRRIVRSFLIVETIKLAITNRSFFPYAWSKAIRLIKKQASKVKVD